MGNTVRHGKREFQVPPVNPLVAGGRRTTQGSRVQEQITALLRGSTLAGNAGTQVSVREAAERRPACCSRQRWARSGDLLGSTRQRRLCLRSKTTTYGVVTEGRGNGPEVQLSRVVAAVTNTSLRSPAVVPFVQDFSGGVDLAGYHLPVLGDPSPWRETSSQARPRHLSGYSSWVDWTSDGWSLYLHPSPRRDTPSRTATGRRAGDGGHLLGCSLSIRCAPRGRNTHSLQAGDH